MVVGILEDNFLFRKSLENYLSILGNVFVSFSEATFSAVAQKKYHIQPDMVLLDIHLDDVNGIYIIKDLKKLFPHAHIIIITGDTSDDFILKSIQNGANGYLYKPFSFDEFRNTITSVQERGSFMQPEALTKLMKLISSKPVVDLRKKFNLTSREMEIVNLIKDGYLYKEVAETLKLSYHTINHHLKNIYIKFNVNSRSQLVAKYLRNGEDVETES